MLAFSNTVYQAANDEEIRPFFANSIEIQGAIRYSQAFIEKHLPLMNANKHKLESLHEVEVKEPDLDISTLPEYDMFVILSLLSHQAGLEANYQGSIYPVSCVGGAVTECGRCHVLAGLFLMQGKVNKVEILKSKTLTRLATEACENYAKMINVKLNF